MENLNLMNQRLNWRGGNQEQRMIKDKYRSFIQSLSYSYQAADVQKINDTVVHRALINPDKTKMDYDDKIISIDYNSDFKSGDVFEWVGTNTYWLIYLQELTEDAYFRAEIRRCKYQIQWVDPKTEKLFSTWAYVRGPVETKIPFIQKNGISVDDPNRSLDIYIPNNEVNLINFTRYSKFLLDGVTWEVQSVDTISASGVIQLAAIEDYTNAVLDDAESNLTNAFIVKAVDYIDEDGVAQPIDAPSEITGPSFIKPTLNYTFTCDKPGGIWSIKHKRPVELSVDGSTANITWTELKSGGFTLCYTIGEETIEKIVIVESLF